MKRLFCAIAMVCTLTSFPAVGLSFSFENFGFAVSSDCLAPLPPQPLCVEVSASGIADDIGDAIPGNWTFTGSLRVLFGVGEGTFLFDDMSAANNDFFGTVSNLLFPPDASGIAHSVLSYLVTGGMGIFAGNTGFGNSELDVVVAPVAIGPTGPIFAAACDRVPAGLGGFCERGTFFIPEPNPLVLILLGGLTLMVGRSRPRESRTSTYD